MQAKTTGQVVEAHSNIVEDLISFIYCVPSNRAPQLILERKKNFLNPTFPELDHHKISKVVMMRKQILYRPFWLVVLTLVHWAQCLAQEFHIVQLTSVLQVLMLMHLRTQEA